jgi:hypothetical protein
MGRTKHTLSEKVASFAKLDIYLQAKGNVLWCNACNKSVVPILELFINFHNIFTTIFSDLILLLQY